MATVSNDVIISEDIDGCERIIVWSSENMADDEIDYRYNLCLLSDGLVFIHKEYLFTSFIVMNRYFDEYYYVEDFPEIRDIMPRPKIIDVYDKYAINHRIPSSMINNHKKNVNNCAVKHVFSHGNVEVRYLEQDGMYLNVFIIYDDCVKFARSLSKDEFDKLIA